MVALTCATRVNRFGSSECLANEVVGKGRSVACRRRRDEVPWLSRYGMPYRLEARDRGWAG